jgi:hypothetical protein
MVKLFFLLFISLGAFAKHSCQVDCVGDLNIDNISGAEDIIQLKDDIDNIQKNWNAVDFEKMTQAKCRKSLLSLEQMEEYINLNFNNSSKQNINEVIVNDDEKLVKHFKQMINKKKSLLDDITITTDLSAEKFQSCQTVVCLSKAVFGASNGVKFLYLKAKYGLNPSHLVEEDAREWKLDELDPYILAVENMPADILPIEENRQFIHDKETNGNTMANATISFFAGLDDASDLEKEYTAFHELAHYIAGDLEVDHSDEWLSFSSWRVDYLKKLEIERRYEKTQKTNLSLTNNKPTISLDDPFGFKGNNNSFSLTSSSFSLINEKTQNFANTMMENLKDIEIFHKAMTADKKHKCISKYGETNPAEDFAESMVAYRYDPEKLKKVSIEKYNYIKENVFSGREFNNDRCY